MAGLAIGKDLESRVRGLNQAIRNVNDGIMIQIAEGTLDEVTSFTHARSLGSSIKRLPTSEQVYLETEHTKLATALDNA